MDRGVEEFGESPDRRFFHQRCYLLSSGKDRSEMMVYGVPTKTSPGFRVLALSCNSELWGSFPVGATGF